MKKIKTISFEDAPNTWYDRCSGDGHERDYSKDGYARYKDTSELVGDVGYRPCKKCGEFPNAEEDDACLGHLGNLINACCGHGNKEGYLQFDCGTTIRGFFTIEHN